MMAGDGHGHDGMAAARFYTAHTNYVAKKQIVPPWVAVGAE